MTAQSIDLLGRLVLLASLGLGCSSNGNSVSYPVAGGSGGAQLSGIGGSSAGAGHGSGGDAGTGGSAGFGGNNCLQGTPTSITQIMNGTVSLGTQVELSGVVATSPKFLVSAGATGSCYWGVFVSEPVAQAAPYSGALVVALGAPATLGATGVYGSCPAGTDLIRSDTAPGDVLNVTAGIYSYVRPTCAATTVPAPAPEVRVGYACAIKRVSTGHSLPVPATVADLTELTNAASEAAHRKWTGVLIKLDNVQSIALPSGSPVGSTGSIQLTNGVRVRDRIYQPRTAMFAGVTSFTTIVGIGHLDVCTWAIEPRDPCVDFVPKSQNCP